ncbi:MetQ/NlpA family ABC transporter substrate-binding protein [Streptomyces sp. NPDC087440]|uniref:MetQ/NlpA family ABC transporter substrate-binding protein n=1 Tax=Streptomyces sp. NPDC087440 TaxID=3365790 RepID=UPI00382AFD42
MHRFALSRRTALAVAAGTTLTVLMSGCGLLGGDDSKTIKVGVSGDAQEWDTLVQEAKKEGLDVEPVSFDDYSLPNKALSAGDIDLNAFQHLVFLAQSNLENKTDIVPLAATTVVPMGIYSKKITKLQDLKAGAKIAHPDDPANEGRALHLLDRAKVIELKPGTGLYATPEDIAKNPKNITFTPVNAQQTPRLLPDVDAAIINDGVASLAKIDAKSALFHDDPKDAAIRPYINVIAVREGEKDNPDYAKIAKLYASKPVQDAYQRFANGTGVHLDLTQPELEKELDRVAQQLKK